MVEPPWVSSPPQLLLCAFLFPSLYLSSSSLSLSSLFFSLVCSLVLVTMQLAAHGRPLAEGEE